MKVTVGHFALTALVWTGLPAAAAAQATAAAKPLVTIGHKIEGVSIDLMAVERKGSVLTVKWAMKNQGAKDAAADFGLVGRNQTTYLVDEESGTKYYVLTDKEKHALATEHEYIGADTYGINENLPAGASARYWAKFPAPPPQVKTINVFFTGGAEPIESVAIVDK